VCAHLETTHRAGSTLDVSSQGRKRRNGVLRELGAIALDAGYASLLAIPAALGITAYIFMYLSYLRRHLRSNREVDESKA